MNLGQNYKNYASIVEIDARWNNPFLKINLREKDIVEESDVAMSQEKEYSFFPQIVFPITLST